MLKIQTKQNQAYENEVTLFQISYEVTLDNFIGAMESVEFDDQPMGLWNFEEAENNCGCRGAVCFI